MIFPTCSLQYFFIDMHPGTSTIVDICDKWTNSWWKKILRREEQKHCCFPSRLKLERKGTTGTSTPRMCLKLILLWTTPATPLAVTGFSPPSMSTAPYPLVGVFHHGLLKHLIKFFKSTLNVHFTIFSWLIWNISWHQYIILF